VTAMCAATSGLPGPAPGKRSPRMRVDESESEMREVGSRAGELGEAPGGEGMKGEGCVGNGV
jgi:hypothetical protein